MKGKLYGLGLTAVLLGALLWGCAPRVTVEKPAPDHSPLTEGRSLAIEAIEGPNGPALLKALTHRLMWYRGVTVTDRTKADLILSGRLDATLTDSNGYDLVQTKRDTGREVEVTRPDPFVEREFTVEESVYDTVIEQVPCVVRRADMTFTYSLANSDGLVVQGPETISVRSIRQYGGVNEGSPFGADLDDLPAPRKTIRNLIDELAVKVAEALAPSATSIRFVLDSGEGLFGEADVRHGVKLAEAGRWDEAMEVWTKVLKDDPEHPAAQYNLGVAYERLGDRENLERALEQYAGAARTGRKSIYRDAVRRVTVALRQLNSGS